MAGFKRPTTTPAPDELFDQWLTRLSGPEVRVLLYVIRRTLGFRKSSDAISLDQFMSGITTRDGRVLDEGCGIKTRTTLTKATNRLEQAGLIARERRWSPVFGNLTSLYRLVFMDDAATAIGRGFRLPTTTPVPDDLYDYWLTRLTAPELKAILYIIRRTLGFRKNADTISLRQFIEGVRTHEGRILDGGCGIEHRKTLGIALDGLEEKGLIQREHRSSPERGDLTTLFVLVFEGDAPFVTAADPRALPPDLSTGARQSHENTGLQAAGPVAEPQGVQGLNPGGTGIEPGWVQHVNPRGLVVEPGHEQRLNPGGGAAESPGVHTAASEGAHAEPGGRQEQHSQQTDIQETVHQQTDIQETSIFDISNGTQTEATIPAAAMPIPAIPVSAIPAAEKPAAPAPVRWNAEHQALAQPISELGRELGDEAPSGASIMRAYNLLRTTGIGVGEFLTIASEAKALTRAHQAGIYKMRADGGLLPRKNLMPYFFATLESLLHAGSQLEDGRHQYTDPQAEGERQPHAPGRRIVRARRGARQTAPHRAGQLAGREPVGRGPVGQEPTGQEPAVDDTTVNAVRPASEQAYPVWRAVLDELRQVMTAENYERWLAPTWVADQDGDLLRIAVPEPFHKEWLDSKLRGRIESTMRRLGYAGTRIEFMVVAP